MLDVSIIIVNWNGKELLRKCLDHVVSTTQQVTYEVIVVDNASSDGSQAMVREAFPSVRLIENSDNCGFARANNQGIVVSQGRYVLLLNSDAFVQENTIDAMVAFMDEHPEGGMSGCKLLFEDGQLQPSCFAFPTIRSELYIALHLDKFFPRSREFGRYRMTYWDFNDVREVDVILGAFMLVRREAVDVVGLMDKSYFMYSEEFDWCFRFKASGWKILYNPEVDAIHLWGGSSKQVPAQTLIRMYQSRIQFFRQHYGKLSTEVYKLIIGWNCTLRIILGVILSATRIKSSPQSEAKYRAFWKLLISLPSM